MTGFGAIEWLARGGFLVKGVLYMVVGALALTILRRSLLSAVRGTWRSERRRTRIPRWLGQRQHPTLED